MLAKQPDDRWRSCSEVLRELYRVQLEYCPQATPEELAAWSSIGMEPLSDPRMKAQRQLAEAMRGIGPRRSSLAPWLVALGIVAMFAGGGGAAWYTMRPALLVPPQRSEKASVPHQNTELRQWFFASRIGTEEAWKSVIDYPGAPDVDVMRAKQQLARVYLREDKFDSAMDIFNDLATTSEKNKEFKAFGLAGKCGTLSLQGKYPESAEVMNQLWNYRNDLHDQEMRELVAKATDTNRAHLGAGSLKQWNEWLDGQFKPDG
jgi:hypothetical protein